MTQMLLNWMIWPLRGTQHNISLMGVVAEGGKVRLIFKQIHTLKTTFSRKRKVQGYLAGWIIGFICLCGFLLDCTILRRYELAKTYIHAEELLYSCIFIWYIKPVFFQLNLKLKICWWNFNYKFYLKCVYVMQCKCIFTLRF